MKERATEHPIVMCGKMVAAILAGQKEETRRMAGLKELNKFPSLWRIIGKTENCVALDDHIGRTVVGKSPYGVAGDTLWVREALNGNGEPDGRRKGIMRYSVDGEMVIYDGGDVLWPYKHGRLPSIHMPRWASRITLTVKSVTLERLHKITDEGAKAEGVTDRAEYEQLWKQLNGEESWNLNPWVWVVKFEVKEVRK